MDKCNEAYRRNSINKIMLNIAVFKQYFPDRPLLLPSFQRNTY